MRQAHRFGVTCVLAAVFVLFVAMGASSTPLGSGAAAGLGEGHPLDMGIVYSQAWNPASLGFNEGTVQFGLTPLSARLTADNVDLGPLLRQLTNASGNSFVIPKVTADELNFAAASTHHVQVSVARGIGLSLRADGFGDALLTKDLVDLLADRGITGENYDIEGASVHWAAYFSAGGSVALPLSKDRFYVGIGARRLQGWTRGEAWVEGDTITLGDPDSTAELHVIDAHRGDGYAFDVGAAWRLSDNVIVDAAWLNIGTLTWHDPVHTVYTFQPADPDQGTLAERSKTALPAMEWSTPQTVRAGMYVKANPKVKWAVNADFSPSRGDHNDVRISVGSETTVVSALPVRLGAQYSTSTAELTFSMGLGLHIGPLAIDVGVPNMNALVKGAKEAGLAVSTRLRF